MLNQAAFAMLPTTVQVLHRVVDQMDAGEAFIFGEDKYGPFIAVRNICEGEYFGAYFLVSPEEEDLVRGSVWRINGTPGRNAFVAKSLTHNKGDDTWLHAAIAYRMGIAKVGRVHARGSLDYRRDVIPIPRFVSASVQVEAVRKAS